jgi:serine/threonine-protein kinase HipA
MNRCLYCYQTLMGHEVDYHAKCSKKIFGQALPPVLPYNQAQMEELATQVVRSHMAVTGVQPKLSLGIAAADNVGGPQRFTIVGLWGGYILKPASQHYPQLPEVEDLTMHLAEIARIKVVPHSLIRLQDGSLAYITKRIDRVKKQKLHMEDMCQLTEKLTEDKYRGSYEQVANAILEYSENPGLDVVNFFEQLLFSFLTGNADMHLKNFSLIKEPRIGYHLSAAYDMVATALVNPADNEDLALTLNGKKRKITQSDFTSAFNRSKLDARQQENIFTKMLKAKEKWFDFIDASFLTEKLKSDYKTLIDERFLRMDLI